MRQVAIFEMPHNYRDEIYDTHGPGAGPSLCADYEPGEARRSAPSGGGWAKLPIVMPECLFIITDRDKRVIAATADGTRIRWTDLDIVVKGVEQYNADLATTSADRDA
jgi:hypothetical protein